MAADAEVDADELLVLLRPALPGGRLLELLERGGDTCAALGSALRNSVGLLPRSLSEGGLLTVTGGGVGWP